MENENKTTVRGGIGFTGLLTIAFIVLKLCNVITWKWVWVLAPLWMTWALALGIVLIFTILTFIVGLFTMTKDE